MRKTTFDRIISPFTDGYDRLFVSHRKKTEINKYRNKSLEAVYSRIELTEEQKRHIDNFYLTNYGEKIPYTWHRYYTSFTGIFDEKYFPELLYIPEFEHFMNLYDRYNKVFADKNILPYIANSVGVYTPNVIISSSRGLIRDSQQRILSMSDAIKHISNIGEAFIKPSIDTSSGHGCAMIDVKEGIDQISGRKIDDIVYDIGKDFVVQERIACDPEVAKIHPSSVNTFRIMSYRWGDEIRLCPATMRFGRGNSCLDNIHAGGLCIAIDNDGRLYTEAYSEFGGKFTTHPDTNVVFKGYSIKSFPRVLEAAKKMHTAIPQLGVVHWDFTIGRSGEPILVEGNMNGTSVQLIQRPSGKSAFGDNTAEILQWMRLMKKTKCSDRQQHAFGKI